MNEGDHEGAITIAPGRPDDAAPCALLHAEQIQGGFLAALGPGFLECLYRRVAAWPGAFLIAARAEPGAVVGFVAGTSSTRGLYGQFIVHDALRAALAARRQLLARIPEALETWRYSMVGPRQHAPLPAAELLSMAVAPGFRGRGVGGRLVAACVAEFKSRGVTAAKVTVGSANRTAITLYEAAGFRRAAGVEVHRGQQSQVLVWRA